MGDSKQQKAPNASTSGALHFIGRRELLRPFPFLITGRRTAAGGCYVFTQSVQQAQGHEPAFALVEKAALLILKIDADLIVVLIENIGNRKAEGSCFFQDVHLYADVDERIGTCPVNTLDPGAVVHSVDFRFQPGGLVNRKRLVQ